MRKLIAILTLLACATASAQVTDRAWIVERVTAADFEALRKLEKESATGSPVAMHWWGVVLDNCLYGKCDAAQARQLWRKAAAAGDSESRIALAAEAESLAGLDAVFAPRGPAGAEEKLMYAFIAATLSLPGERREPEGMNKARAILADLAANEPRLGAIYALGAIEGFGRLGDELRAIVEAGYSRASETYRRQLLLSGSVRNLQEMRARVAGGDAAAAVAMCDTIGISDGMVELPPEVLPTCERALQQGYASMAGILLQHHRIKLSDAAAAFYARICAERVVISCASELADYHHSVSGKSADWQLWDVLAAGAAGMPASEMTDVPVAILQRAFALRVRAREEERGCILRLYDKATRSFAAEPRCAWRRPVEIPAAILSR